MRIADDGIEQLVEHVDSLLVCGFGLGGEG
jgi:hypothetical protein